MNILTKIPERLRGYAYLVLFLVLLVGLVALVVVDVLNGGDAAGWVPYVLGGLGLAGSGLAAGNTNRRP